MSALPPKADIAGRWGHVRFVPKAEVDATTSHFISAALQLAKPPIKKQRELVPRGRRDRRRRRRRDRDGTVVDSGGALAAAASGARL
jgi:hypothetical protein